MLSPIVAYPFLAKIGHFSVGNGTLTAEIVLSPVVAYPFLAKNGHSSAGNSTLTAVRVLASKKIGNSQKKSIFLLTFRFPLSHKDETNSFILSRQDKNFESDQ
jgi:hypothetical protein